MADNWDYFAHWESFTAILDSLGEYELKLDPFNCTHWLFSGGFGLVFYSDPEHTWNNRKEIWINFDHYNDKIVYKSDIYQYEEAVPGLGETGHIIYVSITASGIYIYNSSNILKISTDMDAVGYYGIDGNGGADQAAIDVYKKRVSLGGITRIQNVFHGLRNNV